MNKLLFSIAILLTSTVAVADSAAVDPTSNALDMHASLGYDASDSEVLGRVTGGPAVIYDNSIAFRNYFAPEDRAYGFEIDWPYLYQANNATYFGPDINDVTDKDAWVRSGSALCQFMLVTGETGVTEFLNGKVACRHPHVGYERIYVLRPDGMASYLDTGGDNVGDGGSGLKAWVK